MSTSLIQTRVNPQIRKHDEMSRLLESRNVSFGSTLLEPKKSPGKAGEKGMMKLITNAHLLNLLGKQTIYHYEVTINGVSSRSDRKLRLSEPNGPRDRDDFPLLNRRDKCRDVFMAFNQTMERSLRESGNLLYYDLSKTIFTLKKLELQGEVKYVFNIGTVPSVERPDAARFKHYEFIIKPAMGLEIGDLSFVSNDMAKMDRSLEQFLDIATSQSVNLDNQRFIEFSSSRIYLLAPTEYGFDTRECPIFEANHSFLGIGPNKGCRIIEGEQGLGQMTPSLVIQAKKSAFHIPDMSVLEKAKIFIPREDTGIETGDITHHDHEFIATGLIGIYAEPRYGPSGRFFRIDAVTKPNGGGGQNAENTYINHQISGNITIQRYFREQYHKELQFPKAPLLVSQRRMGEPAYYPMELCYVLDGQRVKGEQSANREMIGLTAVAPTVLKVHNERVKDALHLVNNDYLTKASVRFENAPLHVDFRVIGPPSIAYRDNATLRPDPMGEWTPTPNMNYLTNAKINRWVAYAFALRESDSVRRSGFNEDCWRNFVAKYASEMCAKGIMCPPPSSIFIHWGNAASDVMNILRKEADNHAEFALIGHAKGSEGDDVHAGIKVFEQQTEVVTQAVSFDLVDEIMNKGKHLPITNCIHKTNMKMGGLNYALLMDDPLVSQLFDGQTLFLGFAMNYPGGFAPTETGNIHPNGGNGNGKLGSNGNVNVGNGTNGNSKAISAGQQGRSFGALPPPSCVGWTATIGKHKDEYIGDFVYQSPRRDEKIDVVASVVKRCVERFKQNKKAFPKRVIVLRNSCPEGQFEFIMKYEIPLVKKELEELCCDAKLTVLVPNKLQDVRFVRHDANPDEPAPEQNIRPGTVVDTVVVHPKRTEFFLNSHVAIQGTARTPHYTLLRDENDLSMDTLQAMVHSLCFGHQVVTKPTSLPSPVYIADEYAKRGRNIYAHYSKHGLDNSKSLEKIVKDKKFSWPLRNYDDMTKVLSFVATQYLKDLRVNA
uniref:Piwi domain-containing protein n=1 Tax=Globodera rostochiensis TaxID=31243 RepID=A0A914GZ00_GLORO